MVPVVKNHLDIAEAAMRRTEEQYPEHAELFHDLVRRGVLFPLQASRSRKGHDATRRYMIRRILLASIPQRSGETCQSESMTFNDYVLPYRADSIRRNS